jgi:hypothetical protein
MITEPITDIRPEIGFAYIALTQHHELSSHRQPSSAIVLEDGVPLSGPANALHEDIRRLGTGRYSFWHDYVYFAASDNSDPRMNGRTYMISYTPTFSERLSFCMPPSWLQAGTRIFTRLTSLFRFGRILQLVWGVFYWLCFAFVLLCRRKTSGIKEK